VILLQTPEHVRETIESPTPQWLDRLMSWALGEVPQTVQQVGGPLAFVVGTAVAALVFWKRRAILAWWRRRGAVFRRSVIGAAAAGFVVAAAAGAYVWDFTQHDNDFCNSCHVMQEPYDRFLVSEHNELSCHDCHQQPLSASVRQVHLWVLNRPKDIGPHAPVPNAICVKCHVTDDPDATWQRISATAGHRVHLEADTSALADVQCVTCHGEEVHRFTPATETCGQSGCHDPSTTAIVLGAMAGQTEFHCVTCHEFTAPVSETAPLDTVRMALVPGIESCLSCHEMENVIAGFDPRVDPHEATCGMCHNPHTQEAPSAAAETCETCHADPRELTPFHRGLRDGVVENCVGCHEAHTFEVAGEDCLACHAGIAGRGPTASLDREAIVAMVAWQSAPAAQVRRQQQEFDHLEHRDLECADCHSSAERHGEVTVESRAQCLQCHHSARIAATRVGCARCHTAGELAASRTVEIVMSIRGRSGARSATFGHGDHADLTCATCHGGGAAMRVERTCASCHESHHTAAADCASCHRDDAIAAHDRDVHVRGCAGSGCHEDERYGSMTEGRNTCLACHVDMREHRPGRTCADCHQVSFTHATGAAAAGRR